MSALPRRIALPVAGVVIFAAAVAWPGRAQEPAHKPPPEVEEESPKPVKPPPKVDEAAPAARRPGDADADSPRLSELVEEADRNPDPALRKVFRELSTPYDILVWRDGHESRVAPVAPYVGDKPEAAGTINAQILDDRGRRSPMHPVPASEIKRVEHFEERALARASGLTTATGPSRATRLAAARSILAAALRFHDWARSTGVRDGAAWDPVRQRLRDALIAAELDGLRLAAEGGDWSAARATAERLAGAYPDPAVRAKVADAVAGLVDKVFDQGDYPQARRRFETLEQQFSDTPAFRATASKFQARAGDLFKQAQERQAQGDRVGASDLLAKAEAVWPRLPQLQESRRRLAATYATLGVGVHDLPESLSPAAAVTDSERQAVELLFEGLVEPRYDPATGLGFAPVLAEGAPAVFPLGRDFRIARDAYWSNGERLTAADVRHTLSLLKDTGREAFDPAWADLVEGPLPNQDPFRLSVRLRQGYLEPLSLLSFKILPSFVPNPDTPEFVHRPVGTGPYTLRDHQDPGSVAFVANPNYRRASKPGMPSIPEIRFFHSDNPTADFQAGRLHLLLDLPTAGLEPLRSMPNVVLGTYTSRRVYFLAVNHRVPALHDPRLRKALAHAIDREAILNTAFRGSLAGDTAAPHRPLNGPFPAGTWPCAPDIKLADPHDPNFARASAKELTPAHLRLKYPEGDENVKKACEMIHQQVADLKLGIELELVPVPPRDLHRDVEIEHNFELAYYHHDFADELFWIWPLFDPSPRATDRGGPNYMGYADDADLESELRAAQDHRDFPKVQQAMRAAHRTCWKNMPLIPLWQLDVHVAFSKDLFAAPPAALDPLRVFAGAERWTLERR